MRSGITNAVLPSRRSPTHHWRVSLDSVVGPRAPEKIVRPRRDSNTARWPLKLAVRRPNRAYRSSWRLALASTLLLQGCAAESASNRDTILATLKQCLADVSAKGEQDFVSPCTTVHVASLSGITLAQLKTGLGPPGISSDDYIAVPKSASAPRQRPPYECRWAFYALRPGWVGGGPELQCVSPDRVTCKQVRWVMTQ